MFERILIATDGSKISAEAVHRGIALAGDCKAKITVVHVSPTYRQVTDEGYLVPVHDLARKNWEAGVTARAQKILGGVAAKAKAAGVKCKSVHVYHDAPHHAIIDTANKEKCDLIVMGSHGHGGFKHVVLGSETTRVLSHTRIPVLVIR